MAKKKYIFNEVLCNLAYYLGGINAAQICDEMALLDCPVEDSVARGWFTRSKPSKINIDSLVQAMSNIADTLGVSRAKNNAKGLSRCYLSVFEAYHIKESIDVGDDYPLYENISKILRNVLKKGKIEDYALQEVAVSVADGDKKEQVKRVVAFDLDGTLIKGFRYSWTMLFKAVGLPNDIAIKYKKDFEEGKIDYPQWCKTDCEILKNAGLTQEKVDKVLRESGSQLTKNLREAVQKLKDNNCIVAIISGGADAVFHQLLPDAYELFDEVFINRVKFNKDTGIIEEIVPTVYDWDENRRGVEGKQAGLRFLCAKYNAKLKDSVFVGDDKNDFSAMRIAGMKIFYYSYSEYDTTRGLGSANNQLPCDAIVESSNDLMRVADRIISWSFDDEGL